MKQIKLLDVTLRDGGYTNDWEWGNEDIDAILSALKQSKVDVIELGFLRDNAKNDKNSVLFNSIHEANKLLEKHTINNAAMMLDHALVNIDNIPDYNDTTGQVKILRVMVRQSNIKGGLEYSQQLIDKGYEVYIQPTIISGYTTAEFVDLVQQVNNLKGITAFYIVDTFGAMYRTDLLLKFNIANDILDNDITIGWHSHNNLQLSYSLTSSLFTDTTNVSGRTLIIDASIFGIGRGAGNLNIEIIVGALNAMKDRYHVTPLFSVVNIIKKYNFGYDVPFYITAKLNLHPSYGLYIRDNYPDMLESTMYKIMKGIPKEEKNKYNQLLIEKLIEERLT
ncbi:hypothetical protein AALA52_08740 [Lactococcus ileimucosae]|uniref:Pyruvate carboxyltransferase domain-containing protein n=1 Tax=Lactococcus ileimucosae TaxID=2941329 RepID=A0ABV4D458_9LACT